jgi:hypothetical protein
MNRTGRTSQEEQNIIDKTVRTIQAGQDSEDRTTRKGQAVLNYTQGRAAKTGWPSRNSQE